jgi:hypothetical protein
MRQDTACILFIDPVSNESGIGNPMPFATNPLKHSAYDGSVWQM